MSADRQEEKIREAADDMRRDADAMEHHSAKLGEHIDEAKSAAAQRHDAPEQTRDADGSEGNAVEETEDVAGDWTDESAGAQMDQAEDARDSEGDGDRGDAEDPAGEWRQE